MNVSVEWLRSLVPTSASPAELRDLITAHVATVDDVIALRAELAPIVVARVVESVKIPETKLSANKVDAGTGELLDVVCGAPNVSAGKLYPFAPTGTTMPNGLKIEKRKIRGNTSNGMLCSARELGLGEDHEGILELDVDAAPGTPLLAVMPVGDARLDIDISPNRPDLLSHFGIAREVAAITGLAVRVPSVDGSTPVPAPVQATGEGSTDGITVRIEGNDLATRFMGIVIRGVRIGPSPSWLVTRLAAVGSRSINNVVDASNYVLHELGQPTHAYDLAKVRGGVIGVRRARPNERLTTLDGVERALDGTMSIIADGEGPQGLAGVMGGRDSEVTDETTDLFVEVASFNPAHTRVTRRAVGLSTDASYRFERGVDHELAPIALDRVTQLIIALAGGRIAAPPVDVRSPIVPARSRLVLRVARVEKLLGDPVPAEEIARLLGSVGFEVTQEGDAIRANVPTWRRDIKRDVDLIEEVARLRGYDSFSTELRPQRPGTVPDSTDWVTSRRVREALVAAGLLETRAMPFVAGTDDATYVRVANPLAENEAYLRRDVLETLARRAEYNLTHMQGNVRLFEIGSAFAPAEPFPTEELRVAALVMGARRPPHFSEPEPPAFDLWDAKWLAEVAARAAWPAAAIELRAGSDDTLWDVAADDEVRGQVRPIPLDAPVWARPAFGFELVLSRTSAAPEMERSMSAPSVAARTPRFRALPTTPAAPQDLALLVPDGVSAHQVESVIRRAAGDVLESLELFDVFEGAGIEAGFRSLAWRLIFRHPERTLNSKEIDARRTRIVAALQKELNVRPRTA